MYMYMYVYIYIYIHIHTYMFQSIVIMYLSPLAPYHQGDRKWREAALATCGEASQVS